MSLAEEGLCVCVCVWLVVNLNAGTRPEGDLKATVLAAYQVFLNQLTSEMAVWGWAQISGF